MLLTTYRFAEQHCSADPPLRDYFPHLLLQQGAIPSPVAPVQHRGNALSRGQLLPTPEKLLPSPSGPQSDAALVSEPAASTSGRNGVADAVPGIPEGRKPLPMQIWDNLSPVAPPPPSTPAQHRSHAASRDTAHAHRRIWWPRHNPAQPPNATKDTATSCPSSQANADSYLANADRPPADLMTPHSVSLEELCERQDIPSQQEDNDSKLSRRPAAASAAWAISQQQPAQSLPPSDHADQQAECLDPILDSKDGLRAQLDNAWPPLQAVNTVQQQQQMQPAGLQQQLYAETKTGEGDAQVQLHVQKVGQGDQKQQEQQEQSSSEDTAREEHPKHPASCAASASDPDQVLGTVLSNQACTLPQTEARAQATSAVFRSATGPFLQRPGQMLCDFYVRTGFCKFGQGCKFDHPPHFAVCLNSLGLPLRASEPACPFYAKTGACKFGPSCKFDHPEYGCIA